MNKELITCEQKDKLYTKRDLIYGIKELINFFVLMHIFNNL